mgnify:CR=1 FL=1
MCAADSRMQYVVLFLMIRRPPRSTLDRSSAASDVYKRQGEAGFRDDQPQVWSGVGEFPDAICLRGIAGEDEGLSLIHISEPTRPY